MKVVVRRVTLSGTINTLAKLETLLVALSPAAPASLRFNEVTIIPVGAGNLIMTDDSTATGEAGGALIPAAGVRFGPIAHGRGYVPVTNLYFISATASKAFDFIGISEN